MKTAAAIAADLVILAGCAGLLIPKASAWKAFAFIGVGSLALAVVNAVGHSPVQVVLDVVLGAGFVIAAWLNRPAKRPTA